jgi:sugar lactone lactonase YvrE
VDATALRVLAGSGTAGFADGCGAEARFHKPIRLAPFGRDAVLVADIFNHALRVVGRDGCVRTLAGAPDRKGHQDGPAAQARFASPHGVAVSDQGVIAVAEAEGHTIRLLTPKGQDGLVVSTLAGAPGRSGLADGPLAGSLLNSPHAVLFGRDGALYTPDIGNARLRRVRDGRIETVAGEEKGTFVYPMDVAWGARGELLIADAGSHRILRWSEGRGVTAVPVRGELSTPHGVCAGPDGTVYVADMKTHRVLAINAAGAVRAVAGTGSAGGGPGELNRPAAVLVHAGTLWIADLDNHRISVRPLR